MYSVRSKHGLGLTLYMCSDVLCWVILIECVFSLVFSAVNRATMYCDGDTTCYILTVPPPTSCSSSTHCGECPQTHECTGGEGLE